jgi:hypothetical protein
MGPTIETALAHEENGSPERAPGALYDRGIRDGCGLYHRERGSAPTFTTRNHTAQAVIGVVVEGLGASMV